PTGHRGGRRRARRPRGGGPLRPEPGGAGPQALPEPVLRERPDRRASRLRAGQPPRRARAHHPLDARPRPPLSPTPPSRGQTRAIWNVSVPDRVAPAAARAENPMGCVGNAVAPRAVGSLT